jgi:hypothetical protein
MEIATDEAVSLPQGEQPAIVVVDVAESASRTARFARFRLVDNDRRCGGQQG